MSGAIETMLRGFPDLDEYVANLSLSAVQKTKLRVSIGALSAYRQYMRLRRGFPSRVAALETGLRGVQGLRLRARPCSAMVEGSGHYLGAEDLSQFEKEGILGPFPLISRGDAESLRRHALERHENDFTANNILGDRITRILKRTGQWTISYSGLFQALRLKPFWELVTMPELAQRLASLLGDNVICWRSQFFEKRPGAAGTFWHQASAFRESSAQDKLVPTVEVDPGMLQLTAWVALSEVTVPNGALRMVPGTFSDGRMEYLYGHILDHTFDFLARMRPDKATRLLTLALFSPGNFLKAQGVFEEVIDDMSDLLAGREVRDLVMGPGDCVIFSSLNMHASYPNSTENDSRLAFAGRFTNNDVKVYPGVTHDVFPTPEGNIRYSLDRTASIQVHGADETGFNRIARQPLA